MKTDSACTECYFKGNSRGGRDGGKPKDQKVIKQPGINNNKL